MGLGHTAFITPRDELTLNIKPTITTQDLEGGGKTTNMTPTGG